MPTPANIPAIALPLLHDDDHLDWSSLLHRRTAPADPISLAGPFAGKRILITGAAGSIGSALAKCIALLQPEHLTLLDSAEHGLYELQNDLASLRGAAPCTLVPGNICDGGLLRELLAAHRPHIVYHAAAYKHVPLMEHHPLAALETNALGTYSLAKASIESHVEQFIMLSTDKAVSPSSIMGASKRAAELVLLALQDHAPRMKALRLGNVLGSRGSVVPLFQSQIARGGPVTVTDPQVRRYFLPLRESVEFLLSLAHAQYLDGIFIPDIGEPIRILDLAHFLISNAAPANSIGITFTGLRPGDKMQEQLLSASESIDSNTSGSLLHKVTSSTSPANCTLDTIQQLQQAIRQRAVGAALQTLQRIVPEYQPSDIVRHNVSHSVIAHE